MATAGWLILLFPLVGSIVIALGYKIWPGRVPGLIGTLAILGSFVASIVAVVELGNRGEEEKQVVTVAWDYASTSGVDAQLSLLLDPLSLFMALTVTGVSTLIHLYSVSYMGSDRGYTRFFAYLNFFVFSMLLLVLAGNFLILIVGWAFVGAASYLLISFWYRRTTATRAGIKAFVINVVGDVGLVIGTYFIFQRHRLARLRDDASARWSRRSRRTRRSSWRAASGCWSARSPSPPRFRSTPGSRTRWRARRRSPP